MKTEGTSMTRRTFLKATAAAGAVAAVGGVSLGAQADTLTSDNTQNGLTYTRTTCAPNCTGGCGMKACVADGKITSIFPAADYQEEEHNPRGCLKGLSFSNLIYGPERLKKPMLRTGAPGTDEFREVEWDEALDFAAGELSRIMTQYGPESVGVIFQVAATGHVHKGTLARLCALNGWTIHGGYDMNGDLPMSAPMTFGVQSEEIESYCWPDSRYIMVFGSNLAATRVPDAHFLVEARENGAKLLVFDPNYSATAAKADEWYAINCASDAAVALGMVKVLIEEKLYDADFIKTYTDLPILIRSDNGKKLKAAEVEGLEAPAGMPSYREAYVAYNGQPLTVNPEALKLPANVWLEGEVEVTLKNGRRVKAKPAFQLLAESVVEYTPEKVEEFSNMPAEHLVRIARELATTKPLHVIYGASNYQWYHGDLKGRALSLLPVLTGNIGHSGDGFSTYAGQYRLRFKVASWWVPEGHAANWLPFEYLVHGPTDTMSAKYPKHGIKAWIVGWGNPFDQHNLNNRLREMVEDGDLELVINLDFQMTTTSKYSHVLLPGVSWYEKTELVSTPVHPYLQLMQPAIEPLGECKPEFWIFRELAKRIDPAQEQYFYPGLSSEEATEEIIRLLLEHGGEEVEGITLEELRQGPVKMRTHHKGGKRIPFYEQIQEKQPFPPVSIPEKLERTAQFVKSGRIEFYKDEDTFLELGEQLPVHKPPYEATEYARDPTARERFPFAYITRNSIHRVHSTHSNNKMMRELQDDSAKVWLNPEDAAAKGIAMGDMVEVYNDRGTLLAEAVLDPGVGKKIAIFEEGWWSRYTKGTSYNALIYPFINPTNEVYFIPQMWSPNTSWNECLCDVRKAGDV